MNVAQDPLFWRITENCKKQAVQLSLHLCAQTSEQGHACGFEMQLSWYDMYYGGSFLVRHDFL
jgi:hypothetical protein